MHVQDVMSHDCEYLKPGATLLEAAKRMRDLDCGFLPIADAEEKKLQGVITDRDIVVRGLAEGKDPAKTKAADICTDKVLYCYQDDGVATAAKMMQDNQVYRLIVLGDRMGKNLTGVITLGDIVRHDERKLASETARHIAEKAA